MDHSIKLKLKQKLVGTAAGRLLESVRDNLALVQAIRTSPERGSRMLQDHCGRTLLSRLCEPDKVFMDVGAHIGSVTAAVLHHSPGISVIAVEAVPEKAEWLKHKFPMVEVHHCAVGSEPGEVEFQIDLTRPGFSSLATAAKSRNEVRTIRVVMHRLDGLYAGKKPVGVIKIDVEGMELAVIRGASALIARDRPVIYFESGPTGGTAFGFTSEQLFDCFAQQQYQIYVPNRVAHDGPPLTRDSFNEAHHYPQRALNYFAIPTERRTEIRDRARLVLEITI